MHPFAHPLLVPLSAVLFVVLSNAGFSLVVERFRASRVVRLRTIRNGLFATRNLPGKWTGLLVRLILRALLVAVVLSPPVVLVFLGKQTLHHPPVFFMAVALVFGIVAYAFKRKQLLAYGLSEIVFGTLSASRIAEASSIPAAVLTKWVALIGAMYVVSRGCGNIADFYHKRLATPDKEAESVRIREQNRRVFESRRGARRGATPEYFAPADTVQTARDVLSWLFGKRTYVTWTRAHKQESSGIAVDTLPRFESDKTEPSAVAFLDDRYARGYLSERDS